MYGHFDAIKRRKKLRKEKTESRTTTLEKRKENLFSNEKEGIKERFSQSEIQESIKNIKEKHKKIIRKQIWLLSTLTVVLILTVIIIYFS